MKDIIIDERYRVDRKIGQGGFGLVYVGTDTWTNEEVAIKLSHISKRDDTRLIEAETCQALSGGVGLPRILWFGKECEYDVLVSDLLGPSLDNLFNYCGCRFSLKTILLIADQAISRIQYVHNKGFLHRDVKPDNFLMGVGKRGNTVYITDFGLARRFAATPKPRPQEDGEPFEGTYRYASINTHCGREQSWADDLESLGYMLVYFHRGSLPWQDLEPGGERKSKLVKEKKMSVSAETLCQGLPVEFVMYINYARSLEFMRRPDYAYLRRLFRRLFDALGFKHDYVFDWTERLFHEMKNQAELTAKAKNTRQVGK